MKQLEYEFPNIKNTKQKGYRLKFNNSGSYKFSKQLLKNKYKNDSVKHLANKVCILFGSDY